MQETWKDIPKLENLYQLSDKGRVRSLDRRIHIANRQGKRSYIHKGRMLKLGINTGNQYAVLRSNGKSRGFTIRIEVLKMFRTYDRKLRIRHIDGNRGNCAIENLEQYCDEVESNLELPHICNRNCGEIAKTEAEADEKFPFVTMNDKKYFRSNCITCRNNEEKLRQRSYQRDMKLKRAAVTPEKYNSCYNCGFVQLKKHKECKDCNSAELTQFEEV